MRILAFSDLHGHWHQEAKALIAQHAPDWIVLLGDMLPSFRQVAGQGRQLECQRSHWEVYGGSFTRPGIPTLFIRGNHEVEGFRVPPQMRGIPAELQDRVACLEGIPVEFGGYGWAREWEEKKLAEELQGQVHDRVRIILSHVPPFMCLDQAKNGQHIGHRPLRAWLEGQGGGSTELVLCGHVHEAFGTSTFSQALVVNLAMGYALLDGNTGSWSVVEMETMAGRLARNSHDAEH